MRIDALELFHLAVPYKKPKVCFHPAMGNNIRHMQHSRQSLVVRLESAGVCGWGEAVVDEAPFAHEQWAASSYDCLNRFLAPILLGQMLDDTDQLWNQFSAIAGNNAAKAAIDIAWWDCRSKQQGKPLYHLLGGTEREVSRIIYHKSSEEDAQKYFDAILQSVNECAEQGLRHTLVPLRPGVEAELLKVLQSQFADLQLHADGQGLYSIDQQSLLYRLDDFSLKFLMQPLLADDLVGHAMLGESIHTPICLAEAVTSQRRAEQAIDVAACQWMELSLTKLGGLTPAQKVAQQCDAAGIKCVANLVDAGPLVALASQALCGLPSVQGAICDLPGSEVEEDYLTLAPTSGDAATTLQKTASQETAGQSLAAQGVSGQGVTSAVELSCEPDAKQLQRYCLAHALL